MADLTDAELDQLINDLGLRPSKGPGARAACGTDSGYRRHRRHGETPCQECLDEHRVQQAELAHSPVRRPSALKPIAHGTLRGYKQHWYRKEQPCAECREANRRDSTERARRKRGEGQ